MPDLDEGGLDEGRLVEAGPDKARELRLRVLSAAALLPVALGGLWLGGVWWLALVGLAAAGCLAEWAGLCARASVGWAWPVCGTVAILAAGATLAWLRTRTHGGVTTLALLVAVWSSDVGAFAAGRAIGGPRLAPRISPGKTWAGAAGGLVAATVVSAILAAVAGRPVATCAAVGLVLAVAAQVGDLAESAAKRRFGVKDSGRIIPGHGGLLDRLDGLIAAAPVAAIFAWGVAQGT